MRFGLCLLIALLCACAPWMPATAPPQLQQTPGAFITITDTRLIAPAFQLEYPASWRVVKTSPADAPRLQIVFADAAGSTLTLSEIDSGAADETGALRLENGVALALDVRALGSRFAELAGDVIASIRAR